jgi:hypothetical protein
VVGENEEIKKETGEQNEKEKAKTMGGTNER